MLEYIIPSLDVLYVVALFGLAFAVFSDHLQIIAKYQGTLNLRVAAGYNLAMKVMVVNRIGAVLYFLLISFNIDNGLSHGKLSMGLGLAVLSVVPPTMGLMIWLQKRIDSIDAGVRVLDVAHWPKPIVLAAFLATMFNLLGLTLPWVASAAFPEQRLTLANTSFLFNTVFTVINVFFIEHRFARLIDSEEVKIHGFVAGVIMARLLAFFMVGIGLVLFA
jgi:hypothetical protein